MIRIKGKVEQSRERSSAFPTPLNSSYWKESLLVALDNGRQLYLYIYIYIYIYMNYWYMQMCITKCLKESYVVTGRCKQCLLLPILFDKAQLVYWITLKYMLDGNYTRMLPAMNKSHKQHTSKQPMYGHLPSIPKTIQIKQTRHARHCWWNKDEIIIDLLLWTPSHR